MSGGGQSSAQTRFLAGDGLRAIAALSVLLFHLSRSSALEVNDVSPHLRDSYGSAVGGVLTSLNVGLYIFFVLSGYLVGGPFVRAWVEGRKLPRVGRFLDHRIRRIYPAAWLLLAYILVRHGLFGASAGQLLALFGLEGTLFPTPINQNLQQLWTLNIEVMFYAAIPIVAIVVGWLGARGAALAKRSETTRRTVMVVLLLAGAAGSLILRSNVNAVGKTGQSLACLFCAFVPGMLLAAVETPARRGVEGKAIGRRLSLGLVGLTIVLFAILSRTDETETGRLTLLEVLVGGGIVASALVWQWATGSAWRPLISRPMLALGRWSYGIYLWHIVVIYAAFDVVGTDHFSPKGNVAFFLVPAAIGSVIVAATSWRYLERPILHQRRRQPSGVIAA